MNPGYEMLLSKLYKDNLIALVIDEAHCVKMWQVYKKQKHAENLYSNFI